MRPKLPCRLFVCSCFLALGALGCTGIEPPTSDTSTTTNPSSSLSSSSETSETGEDPDTDTSPSSTEPDPSDATLTDFVPSYDLIVEEDCDTYSQDCPEGEKCVPFASAGSFLDANKCVPVLGEQGPGQVCVSAGYVAATDDCDATSMCWDLYELEDELVGTCVAFCTGSPDSPECEPGSQCLITGEGSVHVCIDTCDPLLQDCAEGYACYWNNTGPFNCLPTSEDHGLGEPCGFVNDCAAGHVCQPAELFPACLGSSCCASFCELGAGDVQCEDLPGTGCVPLFEEGDEPAGFEEVGVCVLP